MIKNIPSAWVKSTIGSVFTVLGGGTPSTKVEKFWDGNIPWITSADIYSVRDVRVSRYINEEAIQNSTTNKVPPQTLLVVTRVGLGKIAIAETDMCFSQDLQGLISNPNLIVPEYALYYISYVLEGLKFEGRGTTISGITKKQLKDTEFIIPPYNEQIRIVEKVNELFEKISVGKEHLQRVVPYIGVSKELGQIPALKLSVLKQAFSGKLVAQDPADEPASVLLERIKAEKQKTSKDKKRKAA